MAFLTVDCFSGYLLLMSANKISLISGAKIGEICAEDDMHFLDACFIDKPQLSQLLDLNSNSSILLGRTGSGKSAIMRQIANQPNANIRQLDLETLFFQHVSNSNTFKFFTGLGANLDVIFALLWKHVLLVEAVKLYFDNRPAFEFAVGKTRDQKKNLSNYIKKWESDFWSNTEVVMQEVILKFEDELRLKAGVDIKDVINLGYEGVDRVSDEQKTQIKKNIQEVVNTSLASSLHGAIADLNELTKTKTQKYYLTLDELDESWVSVELKYKLIRALFEAIKKFRKVRKVKILIALRNDLYERSISETADTGYQSEKYSGFLVHLNWTSNELRQLLEARIQELFRWKYTPNKTVKFYDLFPEKIRRKHEAFEYLIQRTLMRPRDLIEFVNEILEQCAGQRIDFKDHSSKISSKSISIAEEFYSHNRKRALIEEWTPTMHPQLEQTLNIVNNLKENFNFENEKLDRRLGDIALEICAIDVDIRHKDCIAKAADIYLGDTSSRNSKKLKQEIFAVLFKLGVLHIKTSTGSSFKRAYDKISIIPASTIGESSKFRIDPTYWRALSITPNM